MGNLAIKSLKSEMLSSKLNKFVSQEVSIRKAKPSKPPNLIYLKSKSVFPYMLHFGCTYFI